MALNEQLIHRNEQVDVAYIGTDTTENLRSLIRRLKADESVNKSEISMFILQKNGMLLRQKASTSET